jgi:hypothetical protein
MEPSRSRLGQLGKSYMTDSIWSEDPKNLESVSGKSRGDHMPSSYYYGGKETLERMNGQSYRSTYRSGDLHDDRREHHKPKGKSRNVMMNVALASMMQQEDRAKEEKKELLVRAAELQSTSNLSDPDQLVKDLRRDVGEFDQPEEEELVKKIVGVQKLLVTEKRIRERKQQADMQRSQQLIGNLLQFAILMNGSRF